MDKDHETNPLVALSDQLAAVVAQVGPSVVRVDDRTRLTATGLIWSANGVIVATSHGVERDEDVVVELGDGARHAATVIGRDPDTDVAALRVAASGLPAVERASSDDARPGALALALGRPGGAGLQATVGIISSRLETQTGGRPGYLLYTDAVLYPGFSGGALVDVRGRLLGLTNLLYGRGRGIAIGTPVVEHVVETLLAHGRVRRGYLGVRTQPVTLPEALRTAQAGGQEAGLLIVQVEPVSPAEAAGLLLGDTLLLVEGEPVADGEALRRQLRARQAGQTVTLRILRGGEARDVSAVLGAEQG